MERRLQEIEREMRTERQHGERRQDQLGHVSLQLQEVSHGLHKEKHKGERKKSQAINQEWGSVLVTFFQICYNNNHHNFVIGMF